MLDVSPSYTKGPADQGALRRNFALRPNGITPRMTINQLLTNVDVGSLALPVFQRGYVWNRAQVRGLIRSLYLRHPVGSLLVWTTSPDQVDVVGGIQPGIVGGINILLDGQQRISSIYGVVRGKPPQFFDGDAKAFTGLRFHVELEQFEFYQPVKMKADPLWLDVTRVMQAVEDVGALLPEELSSKQAFKCLNRLVRLQGILSADIHVAYLSADGMGLDTVVRIFNKVNSGGTKLSKADLALASVCSRCPSARQELNVCLGEWEAAGFDFQKAWLLRCVNAVITGEARFSKLHHVPADAFLDGLARAKLSINQLLNRIGGRLGLDHDRVLFGKNSIPVMVRFLELRGGKLTATELDRLLFWYVHASMWGRFSGSAETIIDKDLEAIEAREGRLNRLIGQLRDSIVDFIVSPQHFQGWSRGARFYPVLYMLTRVDAAKDFCTGQELKANLLGKMAKLELHHLFPKAYLWANQILDRKAVNSVANFCFLTKAGNLEIGATPPEQYFAECEAKNPGVLRSQWIPMDESLWRVERYSDFLAARRELLAHATNRFLCTLAPNDIGEVPTTFKKKTSVPPTSLPGGIANVDEERVLEDVCKWLEEYDLPRGTKEFELVDSDGSPIAVLDLAWHEGLQPGRTQAVAILLNEPTAVRDAAERGNYRCFTSTDAFRKYVREEVLEENGAD